MGYEDTMIPQGVDVERGKRIMAWIRQGAFERIVPFPEDDPFILYQMFVDEMKSDAFHNLEEEQQMMLLTLIDLYRQQIEMRQEQQMRQQMEMMEVQMKMQGGGGQ
jgi:hypothetical protein